MGLGLSPAWAKLSAFPVIYLSCRRPALASGTPKEQLAFHAVAPLCVSKHHKMAVMQLAATFREDLHTSLQIVHVTLSWLRAACGMMATIAGMHCM